MSKRKGRKKKQNKLLFLGIAAAILIIAVAVILLWYMGTDQNSGNPVVNRMEENTDEPANGGQEAEAPDWYNLPGYINGVEKDAEHPPVRKSEDNVGRGDRFSAEEAGTREAEIDRKRLTQEQFQMRREKIQKEILEARPCQAGQYEQGEPMRCRAGRTSFWINWKGEMTPCGMMVTPSVYPFRDGLMPAWMELREKTEKIILPVGCRHCRMKDLCPVCAAVVYAETGRFDEVPQYLCRMTRAKLEHTLAMQN